MRPMLSWYARDCFDNVTTTRSFAVRFQARGERLLHRLCPLVDLWLGLGKALRKQQPTLLRSDLQFDCNTQAAG